jgi:tRNA-intron endonuclease, archaea type
MAKTKKSTKAAKSETLLEQKYNAETFTVENPQLDSDLTSIEIQEIETKEHLLVEIDEKNEKEVKTKARKKALVKALLTKEKVITEASDEAREFYNQSRFGTITENGKVEFSLLEGLYLFEKGKLDLRSEAGRKIGFESYIKKAKKVSSKFWIRYSVYKDIRNRGYIAKTALKFGADFRIYDRGVKPGEDHARWIVFPVHESETLTWHEWAAKNRVAHSTKKRLLMAVVDDEGDVSYWEARWIRP